MLESNQLNHRRKHCCSLQTFKLKKRLVVTLFGFIDIEILEGSITIASKLLNRVKVIGDTISLSDYDFRRKHCHSLEF